MLFHTISLSWKTRIFTLQTVNIMAADGLATHGIDLVCPEYSGLSTRSVNPLPPELPRRNLCNPLIQYSSPLNGVRIISTLNQAQFICNLSCILFPADHLPQKFVGVKWTYWTVSTGSNKLVIFEAKASAGKCYWLCKHGILILSAF